MKPSHLLRNGLRTLIALFKSRKMHLSICAGAFPNNLKNCDMGTHAPDCQDLAVKGFQEAPVKDYMSLK